MKNAAFARAVDAVAADGPARFASWDDQLFQAYARGPISWLAERLKNTPGDRMFFESYVRLVQEAIGAGYATQYPYERRMREYLPHFEWASVLELGLTDLIPLELSALAEERRAALLADIWNLGEGLRHQPRWLDRYVAARLDGLDRLDECPDRVADAINEVLGPAEPSSWAGPFSVSVVSTRSLVDDFLPGDLHLLAPAVACVHDRRREDIRLQIVFRRGGASMLSGPYLCISEYDEWGELPDVTFAHNRVRIAERHVDLPFLSHVQSSVVAVSGYLIATAVDSQRLWIVESAK